MDILLDITIIAICIVFGFYAAYWLNQNILNPPASYILGILSLIISLLLIWFVDMELPIEESTIRDSSVELTYFASICLYAVKFFLFGMVLYSFDREK